MKSAIENDLARGAKGAGKQGGNLACCNTLRKGGAAITKGPVTFSGYARALRALACLSLLSVPVITLGQTNPGAPLAGTGDAPREATLPRDPIAIAAHGALLDHNLKPISITPELVRRTLDLYIRRLSREAHAETLGALEKYRSALAGSKEVDEIEARFLMLEYLLEAVKPKDRPYLGVRNKILRRIWYRGLYGLDRLREEIDPRINLPKDIVAYGERTGMVVMATEASGGQYRAECRKAGVPIPPDWGSSGWTHEGDLSTNFLGFGSPAEVWSAKSESPKGICVALPRVSGSNITALGIICLGTETNNACFYDASDVPVGSKKPIEEFLAGNDLWNGVCTDCHAGENPYVVHPAGPLNLAPDNMGSDWYSPLIKPSWPQNPGPFALLAMVPINKLPPDKDESCLDCHYHGSAGRFPDILALNAIKGGESDYCRVVLKSAVGDTMPAPGSAYDKHIQAMFAFCGQQTPPSGEVPPPDSGDDRGVISPPLVLGPLYDCASAVEVAGGIYGAKITVSINGVEDNSATVTQPSRTIIGVTPLEVGDVVTAVQNAEGVPSVSSSPVTVIDHTVAYPSGLPRPEIDPAVIYECGHTIAVRHVRGATVTVFTNGGDPATYVTGGDWTNLPPRIRPFKLGDRYTTEQSLCTDVSGLSNEETAGTPPVPMPTPAFNPAPPVAGQPVVNVESLAEGALTVVGESSAGDLSTFSTAVTWQPEVDVATGLGRLVAPGDSFFVIASLCDDAKVAIPKARPCERLDAPRIATPLVGQTFVTVTDAVPGARILVYDAALNEIGDGSGTVVGLTRPIVPGDILTVTQRLEQCASSRAYQTGVVCAAAGDCG